MDAIRIIRDKAELQGTCYFELLPGEYKEQCWNDGSLFVAEDVFSLIEPLIARHEPQFDHYSFVGIQRDTWDRIIVDLERLAERATRAACIGDLTGDVGFLFTSTETEFASEFRVNADALARLASELARWLRQQLREHQCISLLGM